MKKNIIFIFTLFLITNLFSQNTAQVEKSLFGIQTGVLGIWGHNEARISNTIVLRTEFGFDTGIFGGDFYDNTSFILYPSLNVEPRMYYNLTKRKNKGHKISNNSGNFFSLRINYIPDLFVISNVDNVNIIESIAFIPKWGIKRSIGKHFTYEAGLGYGIRTHFLKKEGFKNNESDGIVDLHLRIGYTF